MIASVRIVEVEQQEDGLWTWWCTLDGVSTGPWPGYFSEEIARAAANCWYPLPEHAPRVDQ